MGVRDCKAQIQPLSVEEGKAKFVEVQTETCEDLTAFIIQCSLINSVCNKKFGVYPVSLIPGLMAYWRNVKISVQIHVVS